jgi:cell division protein FtsN
LSSSPDFFGDEQQHGSVSQINPFLPNLLLGHDVCAGLETLTKTPNQTKPNQPKPNQPKPNQTKPNQTNKSKQNKTKQNKTKQNKTKHHVQFVVP